MFNAASPPRSRAEENGNKTKKVKKKKLTAEVYGVKECFLSFYKLLRGYDRIAACLKGRLNKLPVSAEKKKRRKWSLKIVWQGVSTTFLYFFESFVKLPVKCTDVLGFLCCFMIPQV